MPPYLSGTETSPMLREWLALAEIGRAPKLSAEIDMVETIARFARFARQRPINWHDALAALSIAQQLGAVLLDNNFHDLPPDEIRRAGAIVHELVKHVGEFIERNTGSTLEGSMMPVELKN